MRRLIKDEKLTAGYSTHCSYLPSGLCIIISVEVMRQSVKRMIDSKETAWIKYSYSWSFACACASFVLLFVCGIGLLLIALPRFPQNPWETCMDAEPEHWCSLHPWKEIQKVFWKDLYFLKCLGLTTQCALHQVSHYWTEVCSIAIVAFFPFSSLFSFLFSLFFDSFFSFYFFKKAERPLNTIMGVCEWHCSVPIWGCPVLMQLRGNLCLRQLGAQRRQLCYGEDVWCSRA